MKTKTFDLIDLYKGANYETLERCKDILSPQYYDELKEMLSKDNELLDDELIMDLQEDILEIYRKSEDHTGRHELKDLYDFLVTLHMFASLKVMGRRVKYKMKLHIECEDIENQESVDDFNTDVKDFKRIISYINKK